MTDLFTRDDYVALPEDFPAQLVEGCLVKSPAPAPGHQRIASRLHVLLASVLGPDRVLESPVDVVVDELNVYQPDLVVLASDLVPDVPNVGIPRIAVEILSPSTAHQDREVKAGRLLAAGVEEVWLLDAKAFEIEIRDREASRVARGGTPIRSRVLPDLELVPRRLFG